MIACVQEVDLRITNYVQKAMLAGDAAGPHAG